MTEFGTTERRAAHALSDTLRALTGIERASQRRAARTLLAALADRPTQAAIATGPLHTELRWQETGSVSGQIFITRTHGRTTVDLWISGIEQQTAEDLAQFGGAAQADASVRAGAPRRVVLHMTAHSTAEAAEILAAYVRVTAPSRLELARAAHGAAQDELVAAVREELARCATAYYPRAAWLIVDPARWSETWGESGIELRAVIAADGEILHEHQDCQGGFTHPDGKRHTEWGYVIDTLLTELADLDGTGGWPEVCRVIQWDCELRAVPLTSEAAMKDCRYPHDEHEEWDEA